MASSYYFCMSKISSCEWVNRWGPLGQNDQFYVNDIIMLFHVTDINIWSSELLRTSLAEWYFLCGLHHHIIFVCQRSHHTIKWIVEGLAGRMSSFTLTTSSCYFTSQISTFDWVKCWGPHWQYDSFCVNGIIILCLYVKDLIMWLKELLRS